MFSDIYENFTMVNSSSNVSLSFAMKTFIKFNFFGFLQIKFLDYNFTASNILNLNWILHLNKTIDFHSLVIFEGSSVRIRMEKSTVSLAAFSM